MKRQLKYIIAGAFLVAFTGCDLNVIDRNAALPSAIYTTLSGAQSGINAMYRNVNDFDYYGQTMMVGPEILADNLQINNRTGRYEQENVNGVGTFLNIWNGRYIAINEANFAIANLKPITGVPQSSINQMLGEAYFFRAMNYFDLLRVYSYEPGKEVNGFNLGVIMRTTPTNTLSDADKRKRGTNVEGYTQVEADLLQAIALLPEPAFAVDVQGSLTVSQYPYRTSKQAAYALLSRVYLYWGKYADAAIQADKALTYGATAPLNVLTTPANYVTSWTQQPHPESIFESEIRSSDWSSVDGANNSLCSMATTGIYTGAQYVVAVSPETYDLFETGDVRKTLITAPSAATNNRPMSRKWTGEKGVFLENIQVIRRSDVLLISAEAKARSGQEPGAVTLLNTLRAARGLGASPATTGTALIDAILKERRLEFVLEGSRWFDLKRLGMNIPKPVVSTVPTLQYTDFRILQQIPNGEVRLNTNLQQNPGY